MRYTIRVKGSDKDRLMVTVDRTLALNAALALSKLVSNQIEVEDIGQNVIWATYDPEVNGQSAWSVAGSVTDAAGEML